MAPGRPALAHQPSRVAQPHGGNESFEIDPIQLCLSHGSGAQLSQAVMAKMEAAFGADFSAVRVHVGPQASRIGAVAFTMGNDIYFAPGRYQPDSIQGQQLIGHELAHVVQQRQGRVRALGPGVTVVQDRALEAEADRLGMQAAQMQRAQPRAASAVGVARNRVSSASAQDRAPSAVDDLGFPRQARSVQPRMVLKGGTTTKQLANAIKLTGIVPASKHNRLNTEIRYLVEGPENFGEVDVRNRQQVELLAYRIVKGRIPRPQRGHRRVQRRDPRIPFKLAVIGAGSTAAYYLDTLGRAHDHSGTVVIGGENPWRRERGRGITYVNHTARQIAMPSRNVTDYGGNDSFMDRLEFAQEGEAVIERTGAHRLYDEVTRIRRVGDFYEISTRGSGSVRAQKVVFAGGSGAIRKPPELDSDAVANRARIIDMNTFVRDKARQEKGRVAIWGSNAAIDAVAAAKRHRWTIVKWLYSHSGQPSWLPGTRYRSEPYDLQNVPQHIYTGRNDIRIVDADNGKLRVCDKGTIIADNLDYVVYGLGSTDMLAAGAGLLDDSVLMGRQSLEAMVDGSGLFADPTDSGRQSQAFLGWQNRDASFQVFGLAAENYEGAGGRISPDDRRVKALRNWVSGDVLAVGQLTYIRSAIRAANHFVPGSIEHRIDYSHADADQIRVHLAARYPLLPEVYAKWFISMIRRIRSSLQDRLPHGFTRMQVRRIEEQLQHKMTHLPAQVNAYAIDAVNWQWRLAQTLLDLTPPLGSEVADALHRIPVNRR